MEYWKIKNISEQSQKVAIALASNKSKGVILEPNEFVISLPQMTKMIDAQERRGFVEIERDFKNPLNIPLGEVMDLEDDLSVDEIKDIIAKFKK